MVRFQVARSRKVLEEDYPLRAFDINVTVNLLSHVPLPHSAVQRLVLREIRRAVGEMDVGDLEMVRDMEPAPTAPSVTPAVSTPVPKPAAPPRKYVRPADLDLRQIKSANRFVAAVHAAERDGRAASQAELMDSLSYPTLMRLIDPRCDVGAYVAPLIEVTTAGRSRFFRLTEQGRTLASQVEAGVAPA